MDEFLRFFELRKQSLVKNSMIVSNMAGEQTYGDRAMILMNRYGIRNVEILHKYIPWEKQAQAGLSDMIVKR